MPELETPPQTTVDETASQDLAVPDTDATVSIPDDATTAEAAAVAAAVGAHLTDRRRVAAAAAGAGDSADRVDKWVLADRLRGRGKRRWPETVERGETWKAAARSF